MKQALHYLIKIPGPKFSSLFFFLKKKIKIVLEFLTYLPILGKKIKQTNKNPKNQAYQA